MKTVSEIAKICDTTWSIVYRSIQSLNIVPVFVGSGGRIKYFDEFQFDLIVDNLFYTGKITHLNYESKMNTPEPLYSREEFLELGHLK